MVVFKLIIFFQPFSPIPLYIKKLNIIVSKKISYQKLLFKVKKWKDKLYLVKLV